MGWPKFLLYNAAGGIAWTTTMGSFAYFAGHIVGDNFEVVERLGRSLGFVGLAIIILPVLIWFIRQHLRKRRQQRAAIEVALSATESASAEAEQPASPPR